MTDNMQIAMAAINKWVYFSLNYNVVPYYYKLFNGEDITIYVPEFIIKVKWTCPISHMIGKWENAARTEDAHTYLIRFYTELDFTNRILLMEWMMSNYNDEIKLTFSEDNQ